jgi:hypothetical protein
MAKRITLQEKKEIAIKDLLNQMFIFAGHEVTYDDIKDRKDAWFTEWTMTQEEYDNWKTWGVEYLRKNLKFSKLIAEREMSMIGLMWGLKFSEAEIISKAEIKL